MQDQYHSMPISASSPTVFQYTLQKSTIRQDRYVFLSGALVHTTRGKLGKYVLHFLQVNKFIEK